MKKILKSIFVLSFIVSLASSVSALENEKVDVLVEVVYLDQNTSINDIVLDDGSMLSDYNYKVVYPLLRINTTLGEYFTSVAWVTNPEGTTLSLNPKFSVRWDVNTNSTAWNVLSNTSVGLGSNPTFSSNYNKFHNQYLCHFALAKVKTYWNLDAWRPDVDIQAVYDSLCNP